MTEERIVVGWTQAICGSCFAIRRGDPMAAPVRVRNPDREQCCDCGMPTTDGIYVRDDPHKVRYPTPKKRGGE